MIDYEHAANQHTVSGPIAAIPYLFAQRSIGSVLDVGCGTGTWLRAIQDYGIQDVLGIDGVSISTEQLLISPSHFRVQDLTRSWTIDRRFDAVFCLEVAEHLEPVHAETLVDGLVRHADLVFFSAAAPDQPGQHHVNCRWPAYWQQLFNARGFACNDSIRWQMWHDERIEPWYRQNIFCAERAPEAAGQEPRIPAVIHPDFLSSFLATASRQARRTTLAKIEAGLVGKSWLIRAPLSGLLSKFRRQLARARNPAHPDEDPV